jgi:hypothetical protein
MAVSEFTRHGTHERLWLAVEALASGHGSLQSRLGDAGQTLVPLRLADFPDELQSSFQELMERLSNKSALKEEGAVASTTSQMSDEDAEDVAKRIVELFDQVCL